MCYDFQFNLSTKNYNIRQASAFFRQRLSNRQHFRQESKRKFFFKTSKNAGIKNIRHNTLFLARIRTASTYWRDSDFIILHFAKMNNKKKKYNSLFIFCLAVNFNKNIRNNIAISMPPTSFSSVIDFYYIFVWVPVICFLQLLYTIVVYADIHYSVSEGQEKPWRRA